MNERDRLASRIPALSGILLVSICVAGSVWAAEKTILLDGDPSDWDAEDILYDDAEISEGVPQESTYSRVFVANDATNLYVGLETKGAGGGSINNPWAHNLYIDTDNNPATGYNGGTLAGGYDWLIQYGLGGFEETAFEFVGTDPASPDWQFVDYVARGSSDNFIEMGISLAMLGLVSDDTPRLHVHVAGDGITTETRAPASEADAKTVLIAGPPPPPNLDVTLDGDLSEWDPVYTFYVDDEIVDGLPENSTYESILVANNDEYLFVGFNVSGSDGATISNDWARQVYIDSDADAGTGFNGGWMANGYDRLVEYGWGGTSWSMFEFTGANQATWGWNFVGLIEFSYTDSMLEWGLPRSLLGDSDRVVLEFSVTGGSVTEATWAHAAESAAKTYRYSVGEIVSRPAIDAFAVDGDSIHLTLSGLAAGGSNTIEATDSLAPPDWGPVDTFESQDPTTNWTGSAAESPTGFYRVNSTTP